MKRLLITIIIIKLFLISACTHRNQEDLKSDIELEKKFEQLTSRALIDTTSVKFRLDTLTRFSWDTLIIRTPYYPIENLIEEHKIDASEINISKIHNNDNSNLLLFVENGKIINYLNLPRDKGDFSNIGDKNLILTRENCIFELIKTEQKFVSGQRIVRIKPLTSETEDIQKQQVNKKNALQSSRRLRPKLSGVRLSHHRTYGSRIRRFVN
jgi:hypothetical protein